VRAGFGLAAFDLTILAVGYAFLYALGAFRFRRRDLWLAGLAYLAGWALLGSVFALALLAGFDPRVWHVLLAAGVIVAVCATAGRRSPAVELVCAQRRTPLGTPVAALAGVVLVVAAVSALIVSIRGEWPSEWDSWQLWVPRAETVYYWHGLHTGVGGWGTIPHPEYPPLLAVMYAGAWHFAGGFHPALLPLQQSLLGIAFVAGVLAMVDRFVPRWLSFPTLALLAVSPGFWWRTQTLMADPALGYMVAAAAAASLLWLVTRQREYLALGMLFLAAGTLVKLEGLSLGLLLAVVVVVAAFVRYGRSGWPALGLVAALLVVEPWRLWLHRHGLPTSSTDYHASSVLHPGFLADRFGRFTTALQWLLHSVFRTSQWLVVVPLALFAIGVAALRSRALAGASLAWLALAFLGLAAIYWIGTLPIGYYLGTSADRVASTIVIVAGVLTPILLAAAMGVLREPARGPG
jgi:hypothetical protein